MRLGPVVLVGLACVLGPTGGASAKDEPRDPQAHTREAHPFGVGRAAFAYGVPVVPAPTAAAIRHGLDWLAAHQSPDGGWEAKGFAGWCDGKPVSSNRPDGLGQPMYDPGVTGLALLAFLGAGATHQGDHPHSKVVAGGLRYLRNIQDPEGCFGPRTTQRYVYNHATAALAMIEAYGTTEDPALLAPAQKALDFIALARNPYFAWRYGVKPGDNDTSVTSWMAMALHSARSVNEAAVASDRPARLQIDGEAFEGVRSWIDKMTDKDYGRVGYIAPGSGPDRLPGMEDRFPTDKSEAMTAVACLLRILLGEDPRKSEMVRKGADLLSKLPPTWNTADGSIDMYGWYYGTLAMFQLGGDDWKKWSQALGTSVVANQRLDTTSCQYKGSWDPIDPWGETGGRIYSTAILTLCLETPFRYGAAHASIVPLLTKRAKDPKASSEDRIRTLALLFDAAPKEAAKALTLDGPDAGLRRIAYGALLRRPAWALERSKRLLVHLRKDASAEVRALAARTLATIPAPSRPGRDDLVAAAVADADGPVRMAALSALDGLTLTDENVALLEPQLASPDAPLALRTARSIRAARSAHARAMEVILQHLKSPDAELRVLARAAAGAAAPPDWARITDAQLEHGIRNGIPPAFENAFGMRFVLVPPGTFRQGSPPEEKERLPVETPHDVTFARPLYVQVTEVTNAQYRRLRSKHQSLVTKDERTDLPDRPVVLVSHGEAVAFADWLSSKDPGNVYRLPTEAEWEYAARAGTTTRFWWGDSEADAGRHENVADHAAQKQWPRGFGPWVEMLPAWRWFETTDGHALTAAAASFPPNPWGLHDVLGNASEWCADWIGDYPSGACVDPKGPSTGIAHVHRGGSFIASPQMARSAMRQLLPPQLEPGLPCPWIGFRLVAELPAPRAP